MMEMVQTTDIEEGELSDSSDEVYTPLQRPSALAATTTQLVLAGSNLTASNSIADEIVDNPLTTCHQKQQALEVEEEDDSPGHISSSNESSGNSSSDALKKLTTGGGRVEKKHKKRKRMQRTVMVRVQPNDSVDATTQEKRARFKKYNVWTKALQEEALTETMRVCDVTQGRYDRSVESYDYSLPFRLNGENSLKRRLSNSADEFSDSEMHSVSKRVRPSAHMDIDESMSSRRRHVKSRLGHHKHYSPATSGSEKSNESRHIADLDEDNFDRSPLDIAREISSKLHEEKDELLVRIVEVLGVDLPIEVYKETQRIEADGGMMIQNGMRRRTPGGVFLFLLKNHERLDPQDRKLIFVEERQSTNKWKKQMKSRDRDRKVEELKKRLSQQEKELNPLCTRKELALLGKDLNVENQGGNLSNPPPSPVGHEPPSPVYNEIAINHITIEVSPSPDKEKPTTSRMATELATYDDDILDVNCGDMDFF